MESRAIVIHPALKSARVSGRYPDAQLAEAVGLAAAIALDVCHAEVTPLSRIRPATYLGAGVVEDLAERIQDVDAELAIVDCALTPVQQRNLERAWRCKVLDRTGLILEIFGARASTKEGRLQVELAHLSYQRSRLVRSWTHLERQRGGFGFMGGPGETQIEADRRQIGERIAKLKRELADVRRTRGLHRAARRRVPYKVVALVGYTNAGKSTLFNRLAGSDVVAADMLFATLDPTMRAVGLPSGETVILSDTVGFVSDLPTDLIAAFRATLEEVAEADLIVHVRDVAHPDSEAQDRDVNGVLADLGIGGEDDQRGPPIIEALNKIDLLSPEQLGRVQNMATRRARAVPVSAVSGEGCDALLGAIEAALSADQKILDLSLDGTDGATIAWLYDHGKVLARTDESCGKVRLKVGLDKAALARFLRHERASREKLPAS